MSVHPKRPRGSDESVSANDFLLQARKALTFTTWQWFEFSDVCRTRDERQLMPRLLFELYLAHKAGRKVSKTEACRMMKVDRAVTGPSYIARLVDRGLVEIQESPAEDRRKHLVVPTERLLQLVDAELPLVAKRLLFLIPSRTRTRRRSAPKRR